MSGFKLVRHIFLLPAMSMANPPTSKAIAGRKRKRGHENPVPKGKAKRHHEESLQLQDLEKKVAQLVAHYSYSKVVKMLIYVLGRINDRTNLHRYATFGGY
jgi:hypothetical protein